MRKASSSSTPFPRPPIRDFTDDFWRRNFEATMRTQMRATEDDQVQFKPRRRANNHAVVSSDYNHLRNVGK